MIREAGCLVLVIDAFGRSDPQADLETFDADLTLADMEIVTNRIARVEESLRKPLPKQESRDPGARAGHAEDRVGGTGARQAAAGKRIDRRPAPRDPRFRLFGEKPRVIFFNTADDEANPPRFTSLGCRNRRWSPNLLGWNWSSPG